MNRIASLVGVDKYPTSPLVGCVADAQAVRVLLERNDDGSINFNSHILTDGDATRSRLRHAVEELFGREAEMAIFFFSGHGMRRGKSDGQPEGILVTVDATADDEGVPMEWVIAQANNSPAKERLIVLDCCHAGAIDQILAMRTPVALKEGVSILAGCRSGESAVETHGRGVFSSLVCAALEGGAADVRGFVTAASIYSYVDEILTPWDQRPLFRTSVAGLQHIRRAKHTVSDYMLRQLVDLFPTEDFSFPLDKSYEPTEKPNHLEHEKIFALLQRLRAARIVEPVGTEHMYYAAVENRPCRLTPLGRAYWRQARNGRF